MCQRDPEKAGRATEPEAGESVSEAAGRATMAAGKPWGKEEEERNKVLSHVW